MLFNYLRLSFRTFLRNKTPFTINLVGMGIALGICIAAYVNYEFNAGFDSGQKVEDIYRIAFYHQGDDGRRPYGVCPMPLAKLIDSNNEDISEVIRYVSKDAQFRIGDEVFKKEFVYADPSFTAAFSIELLSGSKNLTNKSQVLISDDLAVTYFGSVDAVGKPLTQIISGQPRELVVSGVYKQFPSNSSFRFHLLTTFENYFTDPAQQSSIEHDWRRWVTAFIRVPQKDALTRITRQLEQYVKPQNEARQDLQVTLYYIEPFAGMSYRAVREKNEGHWFNTPMPPAAVIAPFMMAGFLLLVACFNFTNNAIAVAGKRLKEIGIRKAIGGKRKELIIQFLSETFVFSTLALGLALFLAEYFVKGWDAMWPGIELSVVYSTTFFTALAILVVACALLAGAYPAFYISSFKALDVLRGTTRFGGTNGFTKALLVFQFTISLAAVLFAIAFYQNAKFQKTFDLGYHYQSVIQVPVENQDQYLRLRDALASNPAIQSIGGSEHHIYNSSFKAPIRTDLNTEKEVDVLNIGENYFKTLNVRMIEGREFQKERASDFTESIVVNEEFGRVFNLTGHIVGTRIIMNDTLQCYIVGVVKDVYLKALFQPLSPVIFKYTPESRYRFLVASATRDNLHRINAEIQSAWKKLFPNTLYTGEFMEQDMVAAMEHFDNVVILYTFLGIVAIIMSVSGLYSLVSLHLQKRTKELGIRKILGAPIASIALLSSRMFLVIMAISFVLGVAGGSFLVNKLMDNIWEYYASVDLSVISLATASVFIISVITVIARINSVVRANPVESLRNE